MMLSVEILETPRKAMDILPWVESCIQEIGSTKEGKHVIRFREGLAKELVEEAYPIGIFAMHHFEEDTDVVIQHVIGNQNYDALVTQGTAPFSQIEVTQAHEGEGAFLRMLHLEREGHVSPVGTITKTGRKLTGISVRVDYKSNSPEERRSAEFARVRQAIERKLEKRYPQDTALIVAFDDGIKLPEYDDVAGLRAAIEPMLPQLDGFCWLAIVGWSKKVFLEFNLNRPKIRTGSPE